METHQIMWRGIEIEITFTPKQFGIIDHIKVRSKDKTPLPVTETGFRSHFMACGSVEAEGGAIAYVTAWLEHAAEETGWGGAQLSLF